MDDNTTLSNWPWVCNIIGVVYYAMELAVIAGAFYCLWWYLAG